MKALFLVGVPGSGKSTFAMDLCLQGWRRINRDEIRQTIFGFTAEQHSLYWVKPNEKLVTAVENNMLSALIGQGKNVVIDNTNLDPKYIYKFANLILNINSDYEFEIKMMDTDKATCIQRDEDRVKKVGKEVIDRMWSKFKNFNEEEVMQKISDMQNVEPIPRDESLRDCVIFDIDGTLANKGDRSAFDWKRVGEDTLREAVWEAYAGHFNTPDTAIIICTGRDGICADDTRQWLKKHDINFEEFHIRPQGNFESDYVIKERMWRDIATRYNIVCMYDDRDQVVAHARRLGLDCFQVNYGNF